MIIHCNLDFLQSHCSLKLYDVIIKITDFVHRLSVDLQKKLCTLTFLNWIDVGICGELAKLFV